MKMSSSIRALMLMITLATILVEKGHAQQGNTIGGSGDTGGYGGSGGSSGSGVSGGSGGSGVSGGSGGSACLNQLMPCVNYLNNQGGQRDPPDSCCDPLKSVIKSNPECLCSMLSNQGTITAQLAGINVTQAQELPARCGQRVNPIACLTTTSKNTPGSSDSHTLRNSKIYLFYPLLIIAALYS